MSDEAREEVTPVPPTWQEMVSLLNPKWSLCPYGCGGFHPQGSEC